jgi:hypothetical protein
MGITDKFHGPQASKMMALSHNGALNGVLSASVAQWMDLSCISALQGRFHNRMEPSQINISYWIHALTQGYGLVVLGFKTIRANGVYKLSTAIAVSKLPLLAA